MKIKKPVTPTNEELTFITDLSQLPVYPTMRHVGILIHNPSRNAVYDFARRHGLHINNRNGKNLFRKQEVIEAVERDFTKMGE